MLLKLPVLGVLEAMLEIGFLGSEVATFPSSALPLTIPVSFRLLVRGWRVVGPLYRTSWSCLEIALSSFGENID